MKFRNEQVDKVKILTNESSFSLEKEIAKLSEQFIIIDLQYSTHVVDNASHYSALVLLKKK